MNDTWKYWTFDIGMCVITAGIAAICWLAGSKKGFVVFLVAVILLVICFFSPLHVLSAHYLFSAHMIVHVLLLLLVGPLIVIGLTAGKPSRLLGSLAAHPFLCWACGVGVMWFWHIPAIFNGSMELVHTGNWLIPIVETISLIAAGMIFSVPVVHRSMRIVNPLSGVLYLFTACVGCTILGILISFSPPGMYHHYLSMNDPWQLNSVITQRWNITMAADQQAAGLIMWVPCCLVYVSGAMYLLLRWLTDKKDESLTNPVNYG
jgi:cytochrome c oxidase assembly factor CtaG